MIQLEQIQRLQERVLAAVQKIDALQQENTQLRERAELAEQRADQLQQQLDTHNSQYAQIEEGIMHALSHLDSLEDAVAQVASPIQSGGHNEGIVSDTPEHDYEEEEDAESAPTSEAELDIF
ncbi:MAG: cell division protein ZapB [Spirochaeta sp.]